MIGKPNDIAARFAFCEVLDTISTHCTYSPLWLQLQRGLTKLPPDMVNNRFMLRLITGL